MEYQKRFDSFITKNFNKYVRSPQIVYGTIILLLALYMSQTAPQLPKPVINVLDNTFFKLFVFILILWIAQVSPSLSILIAIAFLMIMNYVNNRKLFEFLDNTAESAVVLTNTPVDAVKATNMLTMQALDNSKAVESDVMAATQAITTAIPNPDQKTIEAVNTLVNNALSPNAGDAVTVGSAMNTVNAAINQNITPSTITPEATKQAVEVLANAAVTPGVKNEAIIATAANVVSTIAPETTSAVTTLVSAAIQPELQVSIPEVTKVTQSIVDTITNGTPVPAEVITTTAAPVMTTAAPVAAASELCYPMRRVDMSKVKSEYEGVMIEEYQPFTPSM